MFLTNGSKLEIFSGDKPRQLRGPQHHGGWFDELAAFQHAQEAWDMYTFGARLGKHPQTVITTTPRPLKVVKALTADKTTLMVRAVRSTTQRT